MNVYNNTMYDPSRAVPAVTLYDSKGCFTDNSGCFTDNSTARGLSSFVYTSANNMTVEICVGKYSGKEYCFAGVKFGAEYYCGNFRASVNHGNST